MGIGSLPWLVLGSALTSACPARPKPLPAEPVRVAAASDLSAAFAELAKLFEQRTGQKVSISFGSSGLLAKQLEQGAPFDMFAAASAAFVDETVKAGACEAATRALYARGRLVLWTKDAAGAPAALEDLRAERYHRIAIANPEHAPYGKAAKEALERAGLWRELEPRIVYAENVRQAFQFAQTGNADASLVALSLALGENAGATLRIDEKLHAPIEQTLVVCSRGKNHEGGRAFAELVSSAEGRKVLERYGFGAP